MYGGMSGYMDGCMSEWMAVYMVYGNKLYLMLTNMIYNILHGLK